MANRRFADFLRNCREISGLRLNFVTPAGIGHSSVGSWKNIAFAGSGPTPLHSINEILLPLNSCRALQSLSICLGLVLRQRNTQLNVAAFIATRNCPRNP